MVRDGGNWITTMNVFPGREVAARLWVFLLMRGRLIPDRVSALMPASS